MAVSVLAVFCNAEGGERDVETVLHCWGDVERGWVGGGG